MASAAAKFTQKMNQLRQEADENSTKADELKTKLKEAEQKNLEHEQKIQSLTHQNGLREAEIEKLETGIKEAKALAGESAQHGQQNESLTRRLQLLEEEAEQADKTIRETGDKYDPGSVYCNPHRLTMCTDYVKPMSRLATSNERSRLSKKNVTTGSPSTRRWRRNMPICRRSSKNSSKAWAASKAQQSNKSTTYAAYGDD